MIRPVHYDIKIYEGADFRVVFQMKMSDGSEMDLSGYTVRAQLRQNFKASAFVNLNPTIESGGRVSINLTNAQTLPIPFMAGVYDVEIESAGHVVDRIARGNAQIIPRVTR